MADKAEQDMLNEEEANHEGEDVDELLTKHKADIDKLRGLLGGELPQPSSEFPYYDDVFLLRYILSFTSAEKAKVPVQKTLAWRRDPAVTPMLSKCDNNGLEWEQDKVMRTMQKYNANAILACRHDQAPVVVIRPALSNPGPVHSFPLPLARLCFSPMSPLLRCGCEAAGLRVRRLMYAVADVR